MSSRIALRRMAALIDADPEVRAARINAADVKAVRDGKRFAIELVEAACARFATRTCLGERATGRTITFGTLFSRVAAAAAVLHAQGVQRGELVGVAGPGSIAWVVADLACLYLGAVSVPIPTALSGSERTELLARLGVTRVIDDVSGEAPAIAPVMPADDALFSVVFTSGSTGGHKGVMLPERRWAGTLRDALQPTPMPAITIGYLPLSHMAGRIALYTTLIAGGTTWFAASADMSSLFEDLRAVRPTTLTLVPRISNLIYQRFQTEAAKGDAAAVMAALRTELGSRLCFVATGAAPTAPDVLAFLEQCFEIHVVDTYGSTELGRVTVNGRVDAGVAYKLVDVPELGYTTRDHPYPRGELAVKSERGSPGYFGDGAATAQLRDAEGYVLSGDIVEERAPGHIVWIDRKHGVLRLANGESVNPSRLEELFAASPEIDQIFLHGSALRSYVLAVIVPAGEVDRRALRAELDRIAATNGLRPHEVPRDFIIAEPFTVEAGLVAETGKLRRARLASAYRAQLDALVAEIEARQLRALDANAPIHDRLRGAIAIVLGLDAADVADDASFTRLGGDSLSALRLAALIAEHCGIAIPVATLLDPAATVSVLAARAAEPSAVTRLHGASRWATPKDLGVERLLPSELIDRAGDLPIADAPQSILLTGAAGFVGRFVLLELARDREVACIVRAPDDVTARARVRETFAQVGLADQFDAARIAVYAGDLSRPTFGLAGARYAELAERIDAIVHGGALVNHALAYEHLCEPNVLGTAEVARFAITARRKPIHFVSTTGVAAGMRRRVRETETASSLWPRRPIDRTDYAAGYITSKWAAETLLADLHARCGVPVTIARCGMVLPHPTLPAINAGDAFCRLVYGIARTGLAPESFYAGVPGHYDALPVDVIGAFIGGLARRQANGLAIYHATNPHAISLDRIVDWLGVPVEKLPHAAWFPRFRAALPTDTKRSPLAIVERWAEPMTEALELDGERFAAALRDMTGREVPALTQAYIAHCAQLICAG